MKVKEFLDLVNFVSQRLVFKTHTEQSVISHYDKNYKYFEDYEIDYVVIEETVANIYMKEKEND